MKASPPKHTEIQIKIKHHYMQEKSNLIGAQLLRRETADRHQTSSIVRFTSNLEAPVENWRSSTSIARKGTPLPVYRPIGLLRTARTGRTTRGKDLTTLITGADGCIGMHVAAALLDRGESVVGIHNFTPS